MATSTSEQLDSHAFTVSGHSYRLESEFLNRRMPTIVTANSPSSTHWKRRLASLKNAASANTIEKEAESREPEVGQSKYLVVGVLPVELDDEENWPRPSRSKTVGVTVPEHCIAPRSDELAYRVVAQVPCHPQKSLKLYVLTDKERDSGLYNPSSIGQDSVFYFSEFRNNATTVAERKKDWNNKVAKLALPFSTNANNVGGREHFGPSSQDTRDAFVREVKLATSEFMLDASNTKPLEDLIKSFDDSELPLFSALQRFSDINLKSNQYSIEDAEELREQIRARWPQIGNVSPLRLRQLHKALHQAKLEIELRDVLQFVVLGCASLVNEPENATQIAVNLFHLFKLEVRPLKEHTSTMNRPLSTDGLDNLLHSIADYIQQIVKVNEESLQFMSTIHGDPRSVFLPQNAIYQHLGSVIDRESLRLLLDQSVANACSHLEEKLRTCNNLLEKLSTKLTKAAQDLS